MHPILVPFVASLCAQWSGPVQVGTLDPAFLPEASGIAVSRQYEDRYYHINDSGDGAAFYVTDSAGQKTRKVAIRGYKPQDTEDLALGPCDGGGDTCLFVGDIGDNAQKRE